MKRLLIMSLIVLGTISMTSMATVEQSVAKNYMCTGWSTPDSNGTQYKTCCTSTGAGSACATYTRNCGYCGPE